MLSTLINVSFCLRACLLFIHSKTLEFYLYGNSGLKRSGDFPRAAQEGMVEGDLGVDRSLCGWPLLQCFPFRQALGNSSVWDEGESDGKRILWFILQL